MGQTGEPIVDQGGLSRAQRLGDACVVCRKSWPRPRVRVGRLPDSSGVFACDDCAPAPPVPRARRGPREQLTGAGRPVGEPPPARTAAPAAVMEVSPRRRVTRAFGGKSGTTPQARPAGGGRTRRRDP
ncbi:MULTISPECIES: hypothetical protein [Actinomadura]|uniref:Uncharacterized protein n=1 Tax=Actinomadura madurae TaxID=1993 RepID=A0A1I4W7I2_9ACTN|nr:hypothetical protein [Actinomadura madurae]SFN09362.1 hypothetical protein SAMN04489713_101212 [Actinomadura madurae]SPT64436.1 Uncharacterised protein [Actinomadura madurae]